MFRRSLALRIFGINFILLIVPMMILLIIFFKNTKETTVFNELSYIRDLGFSRASLISEDMAYKQKILAILIDQLNLLHQDALNMEDLNIELKRLINSAPDLGTLTYTQKNANGRFILKASSFYDQINSDVSDYSFIQKAVENHQNMTMGFGPSHKPWIFVTRLITDTNQNVLGTLTLASSPTVILENLLTTPYAYLDMNFSLVTSEGIIFISSNPDLLMHSLQPLDESTLKQIYHGKTLEKALIQPLAVKSLVFPSFANVFQIEQAEGKRLGMLTAIKGSDVQFMITINQSILFHSFYTHLTISLILILLTGLVTALFIWILINRLAKPLDELTSFMRQVVAGNWNARFVPDEVGYEINIVGAAINTMLSSLLSQMELSKNERVKQEILTEELKIGHQIQQKILPSQLPVVDKLSMAAFAQPALEVGGDFYDAFILEGSDQKKKLLLVIADAAGKGISACLYSLCLRSMIRSYAICSASLGLAIQNANNLFCLDTESSSQFVTAFAGILDIETLQLTYYSAGHPPAFIKHKDNSLTKLESSGAPLGIAPYNTITEKVVKLEESDTLFLYTDGITEAMNKEGHLYQEERLRNFLISTKVTTPESLVGELIKSVENFEAGAPQHDDITALILKIDSLKL